MSETQIKVILQNTWSALLITVKIMNNKEGLRTISGWKKLDG